MDAGDLESILLFFTVRGPVAAGACLLLASLVPARAIARQLPAGMMRTKWNVLTGLILAAFVGYMAYALAEGEITGTLADLTVPAVFFLSACFVHLVNTLSLQTTRDVLRVSELERENAIDPLMGIYNRRYLERRVEEELDLARRYRRPLAVLMLALDHFKAINDSYGHPAGDAMLRAWGRLLADSIRPTDVAARYGGEEIVILAPSTTRDGALELAERLRRAVESSLCVPVSVTCPNAVCRATVSVGVSALGDHATALALIRDADRALYEAKHTGRNRVVARPVPASPDSAGSRWGYPGRRSRVLNVPPGIPVPVVVAAEPA